MLKKIDTRAVVGMPVFLLVAIIVASIIIGFFAFGVLTSIQESQFDIVKKEIEKIVCEAENMFEYADEGSLVTVHVDLPDSLNFLVLGGLPVNGISEPSDHSLDENMSNNYYFVMDDSNVFSSSSNARFSDNSTNSIVLLRSGSFDLKLELVKVGGKSYVKVYT
jgi:hypothetical protein